jgi:NADPH:quinone reductase-like Zn-dependent oxidoreductase
LKAVRIHEHGGVEKLRYEEAEGPKLFSPDEAIVRLKAAALNRIDIWNRLGLTGIAIPMPHILGADGAGEVVEVGATVGNLKPGDRVCLYPPTNCRRCEFCLSGRDFMCLHIRALGERLQGTYAEFVKLPAENCFPIPAGMSFTEAAAFPLVFMTVWRMLVTNVRLKPGESILIIGIGGGVASAALQIAKKIGARVFVTSSSDEKLERAQCLGADHGINYTREDFVEAVGGLTAGRGVDVVVDCVAGETWQKSLAILARGGRLATCGATAGGNPRTDLTPIVTKHLKIFGSTLGSREEFRQLLSFLNASRIKPVIDRIFPLREAADAQRRMEDGKQFGKIVLRISD